MDRLFFLDVDTQRDFMLPEGALYVPGAERLIPKMRSLFDFARKHEVFVLSSADTHAVDDPEFKEFPRHCVIGTEGQRKIEDTLVARHLVLGPGPVNRNLAELVHKHPQIVVQKTQLDLFSNPVAERLLRVLPERAIVFGVATEYCVKLATLGLRRLGIKTAVVTDAIGAIKPAAGRAALEQMQRSGADLITVGSLLDG